MSQATVHALPSLSGDRLRELRDAGLSVETTDTLDDLSLSEPAYGETIVGKLTPEETVLFRDLYAANAELEDLARNMVGNRLSAAGLAIQHSDRGKALHDVLSSPQLMSQFDNDAEACRFFRTQQRQTALHATFYWHLGERLGAHEWRMGVRSAGRVVKVERRY